MHRRAEAAPGCAAKVSSREVYFPHWRMQVPPQGRALAISYPDFLFLVQRKKKKLEIVGKRESGKPWLSLLHTKWHSQTPLSLQEHLQKLMTEEKAQGP